jgi:hypothetical protein
MTEETLLRSTVSFLILLFVIAIGYLVISMRASRALVAYSNDNAVPILGRRYQSGLRLFADPWFHWQMLRGTALRSVQDSEMSSQITWLRGSLYVTYLFSVVIVAVGFATYLILGGPA